MSLLSREAKTNAWQEARHGDTKNWDIIVILMDIQPHIIGVHIIAVLKHTHQIRVLYLF